MKIKNLKKAIGHYRESNRTNAWGYSRMRGELMLDRSTGELWVDDFFDSYSWKEYKSESIVNLGRRMEDDGIEIKMANVKAYAEDLIREYIAR